MCQHFLGRLAVPGFALWLFGDGGCRGHAVAPSIVSSALGGTFLSSAVLSTRHTERAIISSSSVRDDADRGPARVHRNHVLVRRVFNHSNL